MRTITFIIIVILFSGSAYSATWKLYFENKLGNKAYIDIDSIQRTPEGTILVWRKITSADNAEKNRTLEILYEIDCSRRRFKTLQGTVYGGEEVFKPVEKTDWEYFEPNDLSTTLFKAVCKEKFNK